MEEIKALPGEHFDPKDLQMLALVSDIEFHRLCDSRYQDIGDIYWTYRPELVALLPLKIDSKTLLKMEEEKVREKNIRETDVEQIEFTYLSVEHIMKDIEIHGYRTCPPTTVGFAWMMFWLLNKQYGFDRALNEITERMAKLRRIPLRVFTPPF